MDRWRANGAGLLLALCLVGQGIGVAGQTSAKAPVLLVYGFQPLPGFRATQVWEDFAEAFSGNDILETQALEVSSDHDFYHLPAGSASRRDVYISDYSLSFEPTARDIFFYIRRFQHEMAYLKSVQAVDRVHVIAHSMGGLLVRAYAEIDDFATALGSGDITDYDIQYDGGIDTLVMLATPNYGTALAIPSGLLTSLSRQISPGSTFLKLLNEFHWRDGRLTAIHPDIRYISMAGQSCLGCGLRSEADVCFQACVDEGLAWNGSDIVIGMASAYLPEAENCALIGFDHVHNHVDPEIAYAIEAILGGQPAPAAIYTPDLIPYRRD